MVEHNKDGGFDINFDKDCKVSFGAAGATAAVGSSDMKKAGVAAAGAAAAVTAAMIDL